MSAAEIINELPNLSPTERLALFNRLRELAQEDENKHSTLEGVEDESKAYVDLRKKGISKSQAADLRARLSSFAEDWDRPEAAIYDEDPAR